jgi:hypothetical protein
MIEACDMAVTVNSQSAIEAAMRLKPVVVCGHSFYNEGGFVYRAYDWFSLESVIRLAFEKGLIALQLEALKRFLFVYFAYYCIERTPTALAQAILTAPYPPHFINTSTTAVAARRITSR